MKLGIFLSKCGGIVSKSIDLESLATEFESQARVRVFENFYDRGEFNLLLEEVETNELDTLVLAGDSPLMYKQTRNGDYLFKCLSEIGVNPNKVEVVNLENMVVAPHQARHQDLQMKARLLIEMGIRKIKSSADISTLEISPRQSVAVIGANAGSIAISQHLLDAGFKVYLVHKDSNIFLPRNQLSGMGPTLLQVTRHPRFKVFHKAQVKDFYGYTGDYTLHINADKNPHELHIGAVVLSLGEYPELIKMAHSLFHVDVDETGAIAALDEETARSRTREKGIFITNPLKHDHTDMSQMLVAADAAASMVINLLSRKEIYHQVKVSSVDEELCGGCGVCVKTCMFHAVTLKSEPKLSEIDPRRCMGCGNCVTACPAEARDLLVSPTGYLYDGVEILSEFTPVKNRPLILLITCDGCGYEAMDRAARAGLKWPVEVMPLPVVCGGQIDMQLIMHAFVKGFYGVVTLICGEGCCHNIIGNVDLERRVNLFKDIIVSRGIDADRLHIISTCNRQGDACVEEINRFYNRFIAEHRSSETITLR